MTATRVMDANERLEKLVKWRLGAFNDAYLAGTLSLGELIDLIRDPTEELIDAIVEGPLPETASERQRVQTTLGFITGTVERHAQTEGFGRNAGISHFPGYARALDLLAGDDLPQRDTATTFWIQNRHLHGGDLLRYTGDKGEIFFNQQVNAVNDAASAANHILRNAASAETIDDSTAEALRSAPALARDYKAAYGAFRRRDENGDLPITPEYFTFTFRTFLPAIDLDGQTWNGPNAAWLPDVFALDALLGTAVHWYKAYARDKTRYLTSLEQQQLDTDLDSPAVMDTLANSLRLPAGLGSVTSDELARRLADAPPAVRAAATAVRDTWFEITKGTNAHQTLVRDWLDKPSAGVDDATREHMAVDPDAGTGGGTRDLLTDIATMRKNNIPAAALRDALHLLENAA